MNEVVISNMFGFSLSELAYKKDIANHKLRDGSISAQFNL